MRRPTILSYCFLSLAIGTSAYGDLSLRLENASAVVTGATAGRQLAFFGLAYGVENFEGALTQYEEILVADAAGTATWSLQEISSRSLWFALDVETGAIAVATPEGFPLRQMEAPAEVVKPKDLSDALEVPFFYADVLLVRPGAGVWVQSASRGGSRDLKTKNNALTVALGTFRQLEGGAPAPAKVKRDDVVIVIDPYTLSYFSIRWKE